MSDVYPGAEEVPTAEPARSLLSRFAEPSLLAPVAFYSSAVAICLSLIAILVAWKPTSPLGKYDFSTPEAGFRSIATIEAEADWDAKIALQRAVVSPQRRKSLATLKIRKTVEFGGCVLLFISAEEEAATSYDVVAMEKHAETGMWVQDYVSAYDVEKTDSKLAARMREWEEQESD